MNGAEIKLSMDCVTETLLFYNADIKFQQDELTMFEPEQTKITDRSENTKLTLSDND